MDVLYADERLKQSKESLEKAEKRLSSYPEFGKNESVDDVWLEKAEFFNETLRLVSQDRTQQYGDGDENMWRIAAMWSAYLNHDVSASDVAAMMILHKVSRIAHKNDEKAHDSWIDIAGYASLGDSVWR